MASVLARLRILAVSPTSTSLGAYLRVGAKLIDEKLPERRRRWGTGNSARCDREELRTCAGDAGRLIGLALPLVPANLRGLENEIGDAKSSSLYRVDGRSVRSSCGWVGVRARDGREDVEYDVEGRD